MKDLASETSFTSRINLKLRSGPVRHESYRHFFINSNVIQEGAKFDETSIWWIRWKDYLNHAPAVVAMKYGFYLTEWRHIPIIQFLLIYFMKLKIEIRFVHTNKLSRLSFNLVIHRLFLIRYFLIHLIN